MEAKQLINFTLPSLKPTDTALKGLELMEFYGVTHLALVNDGIYCGLIGTDLLENQENEEILIGELMPDFTEVYVEANQHLFEITSLLQQNNLDLIAIANKDFVYKGCISKADIATALTNIVSGEVGGILVLKIKDRDYSLSEIARLVESNDTKILSSFYKSNSLEIETGELTIKLNRQNVSRSVATLERFGYEILGTYASEPIESLEKERYDMLIKYLEI